MSSARRPSPKRQPRGPQKGKATPQKKGQPHRKRVVPPPAPEPRTGTFKLGYVPGATPGKWISIWRERYPLITLELVPLDAANAAAAVLAGEADVAIAREPLDRDALHVISLYDEVVGVVVSIDSALEAADTLTFEDLAGEVVIVPKDDVVALGEIAGTEPAKFQLDTTEDAIETVASGVGVVVVPMSIARQFHRKDVTFRPLEGAPVAPVALIWPRDVDGEDIQNFIGIVRGRTAQSSRD